MQDTSSKYASDPRTSEELVEAHRKELNAPDDSREAIAILHYRGGREEFELGKQLTESENPEDRAIGADILAQLGWEEQTFQSASVDILIKLLNDPDHHVIHCAAISLGHRNDERAIPPLVKLADHEDALVRFGVTFGLSCHDDQQAIDALTTLCQDPDQDTRQWAVFALGSQTDMDTPELRETLVAVLDDADYEIRGEALVGLARRQDPRAFQAILNEWNSAGISILSIEAAEALADPNFIPYLKELYESLELADDRYFQEKIKDAFGACERAGGEAAGK